MNAASDTAPISYDVIVAGAGFVGLILARALARAGLAVAVVDRADLSAPPQAAFDGRVSAISAGSRRVLEALGLWAPLAPGATAVDEIRVTDAGAPTFVHFDAREMAREIAGAPLGHIIENRALRAVLLEAVRAEPGIALFAPVELVEVTVTPARAILDLADGRRFGAPLAVGADGRNSRLRRAAGINVTEWSYGQAALVATVTHARPHAGVAEERFLPAGPFAVLPLADDAEGRHRSSVVWTDRAARIADFAILDGADFEAELARRLPARLGAARLAGARWTYPLGLALAERYAAQRLVLVGDAAHTIHPIAGQGLNLGIRDAAALAEVTVDAHRLGLDFGMKTVLADYERWRRFDNTALAAMTDLLNRAFSRDFAPLNWARALGLGAMNRFGPARRAMMREAMGISGDLPRLVRGDPL